MDTTLIKKLNYGEILTGEELKELFDPIGKPPTVSSYSGPVRQVLRPSRKKVDPLEGLYQQYLKWKVQWAMEAYTALMDDSQCQYTAINIGTITNKRFLAITGNLKRNDFQNWIKS